MTLLLLPSLAFALPTGVDESTAVPLDVLLGLEKPDEPPGPPASWFVQSSELAIEPQDDFVVEVALDVEIRALEETWVELRVLDGRVRLYDEVDGLMQGTDGHWWFIGELDGLHRIELRGSIGANEQLSLRVAPGVRQTVRGVGDDLDFEVFGAVGEHLPPTELIDVNWSPRRPPAPVREVVQGHIATAAWVEDGDLRVRSKLRWTVRRGEMETLTVQLPGSIQELDVVGPGVASWNKSGSSVTLQPEKTVDGVFEVTLEWRQSFQKNQAAITQPQLAGTTSSSHTLTLAGTSELVLSPSVSGGMRAGAVAELDEQARSIGDARPTAAWTGAGTLTLKALQLTSLEGPALVIDQAVCTEASAQAGRNLLSCRLDVRNASRQYLRVTPAEGSELWSATVNGRGATPVVLEDGTMGIPLERSVETLAGLTTLDVELIFLGEAAEWTKKGARSLTLPTYDAPVANLTWQLRLPPGFEADVEGGTVREGQDAATEIVYATSTEERTKNESARNTWNEALRAYQRNDFDAAQSYIDQTLSLDSGNENAMRLQSNLDVLAGAPDTGADEAMSRRVKDMAKAKVAEVEVQQEDQLKEAERRLNSGDYDGAIALYEELEKSSQEMSRYEQAESQEQAFYSSSSSAGLKEAKKRAAYREEPAKPEVPQEAGVLAVLEADGDLDGVFGSADLNANMAGGVGGLIGAKGDQIGSGGLGSRGSGGATGATVTLTDEFVANVPAGRDYTSHAAAAPPLQDPEPMVLAEPEPMPEYQARTEIDFEDITISGELVKPQGQVLYDQKAPAPEEPVLYIEEESGGYMAYEYDDYESYDEYADYDYDEPVADYSRATVDFATSEVMLEVQSVPGVANGRGFYEIETPEDDLQDYSPTEVPDYGTPLSYYVVSAGQRIVWPIQDRIYAWQHPPPPVTERPQTVLSTLPDLAATTLAIPLPDHGQTVSVVQRLLAPGEASTLEITYRETR